MNTATFAWLWCAAYAATSLHVSMAHDDTNAAIFSVVGVAAALFLTAHYWSVQQTEPEYEGRHRHSGTGVRR